MPGRLLFLISAAALLLTNCASKRDITSVAYSKAVFSEEPFIKHDEKGKMKSWLGMNLKTSAFVDLKKQVDYLQTKDLKSRGEAHITVISPVEFDQVLSSKITMAEISDLAQKMNIQSSPFKPVCIGRGNLMINNKNEETYYVVISSEKLFQIRTAIAKLFAERGGKASSFNPDLFYPHVTLGYTQRDLFYEDGVIKDERSCIYQLHQKD